MRSFGGFGHITLSVLLLVTLLHGTPVDAQSALAPIGPLVTIAEGCPLSPHALEVEGQSLMVWYDLELGGIWARIGPRPDELGEAVQLSTDTVAGTLQVVPQAGGFVLAWTTCGFPAATATFQRFGLDLAALRPPVSNAPSYPGRPPQIAVDDAGNLTLAWIRQGNELKARRYDSSDTPITPEIAVASSDEIYKVSLAASAAGFLAAWTEHEVPNAASLRSRAYTSGGLPQGPEIVLTDGLEGVFSHQLTALGSGGYLLVRNQENVRARLLDDGGQPLTPEVDLGLGGNAFHTRVAHGPQGTWLAFDTESQIFGSRLDPYALIADPPEVLAAVEPMYQLATLGDVTPKEDGILLSWQRGNIPVILPTSCDFSFIAYARQFGPSRGVVDVPALTAKGALLAMLLLATAGVILLHRT